MGRFTAYDQNGRMVADFDKGDYDFLCSYGRTPEEVLDENAKLRKENDTLCRRIDELCMENEQLRNQHTAKARRIVVSDGGVGHCACSACGGAIDQDDAFCRHCGWSLEDA